MKTFRETIEERSTVLGCADWVVRVINSCQNIDQLEAAKKLNKLFLIHSFGGVKSKENFEKTFFSFRTGRALMLKAKEVIKN